MKFLVLLLDPVTEEKRHIIHHVKDSHCLGRVSERNRNPNRTGELYEVTYVSRERLSADLAMEMKRSIDFVMPYHESFGKSYKAISEEAA